MKWTVVDVGLHQELLQRVLPTGKVGPGEDETPDEVTVVERVGGNTEIIVLIRTIRSELCVFTIPRSQEGVVQHVVTNRCLVGIDVLVD